MARSGQSAYFNEITEALIVILRAADGNREVLEQVIALAYTCGVAAVDRAEAQAARDSVLELVRRDLDRASQRHFGEVAAG